MSGQQKRLRQIREARHLREAGADPFGAVEWRRRFEEQHPEVTIVPPGGRWLAVVPLGTIPGKPDQTMIGDYELDGLRRQLEEIYPGQPGQPEGRSTTQP